ncbi:hypothetical protein D1631_10065 [Chryseobacterium nematophagum]|uniref:Uncharacterized protein n=1 Tax=Chryseobacterium nematophagum TaxID=2305228 RepID=A0A3M7THX1_9FLAO|nr:hypothetical protein [Chryseobacterium nematophagum]RNA62249.1 hypothetical protein D1631_10065 [Chryseobacterium nematophagum]
MDISLNKSKEVVHYANEISQKISTLAHKINSQNKEYDYMMENTLRIIESISPLLNENEQNDLAKLIEYISKLLENGSSNFTSLLDLLEWSADKTGKYLREYQDLAKSLGYDLD